MSYTWLAYLPPHLAADLLEHPEISPLDRILCQEAVALFADISGFTPMSEALGQVGPIGTEELSQILNRTFGSMIARITSYGGSIGKFAGDALTVLFPTTERRRRTSLRRAIQCALDMQADLATTPSIATIAGSFALTMKIGIGMGKLLTTTVGDPAIRLEYLLAGSAIDQCIAAQQHASKGAVALPDTLMGLAGLLSSIPLTSGFQQAVRLRRRALPNPHAPLAAPPIALVNTMRCYLPPSIAQRVTRDQQGLIDEHRTVTTLFVRFGGFDYDDRAAIAHLQTYLTDVVRIIARYDGYLRQIDVGDKGSLYIVLFGAPIAHEDDVERALLCALDLRTLAQQQRISTATGITTGRIFCGLVGSPIRREYAAIGDSVNLAARLMSAAQMEQILVDTATRQIVNRIFKWHELPSITVKGKMAPVPVAALVQIQHRRTSRLKAPSYTLPMVGRRQEYTMGLHCFTKALAGQCQVLLIIAEAGMGKSRLVAELMRSNEAKQLRTITSECLSYASTSSYLVWQNPLRMLFGLTPDMPPDIQIARVAEVLTAFDPVLVERMPLLGPILAVPFRESDFTRTLDAQVRKSALHTLVTTCIRHWAKQRPLLLILEDCHWIDELSEELLQSVAFACRDVPLVLLLTMRPLDRTPTTDRTPGAKLIQLMNVRQLCLQEFLPEETTTLIELKLKQLFGDTGEVPPTLLERIRQTAQGNPFYIDELLNLIHDRGIDVRDAGALVQLELPNSLQRLILSRIDGLEEGPKTTLKVGSIIGRLFKARWLWAIYPALGTVGQVEQYLRVLHQVELTQLERSEPEMEYLFKHIITREVAYESLAIQTRAVLHEQVGMFIEQTYASELERWLDVLAYHYGNSNNIGKQREYLGKAGMASKAAFANEAAISYFQRLLPLLPPDEQGHILLELAEVEERLWHWEAADARARAARELALELGDHQLEAQATRLQGAILRGMGHYEQALSVLEQARRTFTRLDAQYDLVRTLIEIGLVHFQLGRYADVVGVGEACLDLAISIGDYPGCCMALDSLGTVANVQGHPRQAIVFFKRALDLTEEHQLLKERPLILEDLSTAYFRLGEYARAAVEKRRALELQIALGLQHSVAIGVGNLGATYHRMGQYAHAQRCYQASLARMQVLDPAMIGWMFSNIARVMELIGDLVSVEPIFRRAVAICRAFSIPYWRLEALYNWAEYETRQHQYVDAQTHNDEALALAIELHAQQHELLCRLLSLRLQVLQQQLAPSAALGQLEALRSLALESSDQALLDYIAWQIDPTNEQARVRAAQQYRSLYEEMLNFEYHQRYRELTGDDLPAPPPLPELPDIVDQVQLDLPAFLARVDALLAEQGA